MLYKPILAAIKAILIADETANGLIETYREYDVEIGVSKTPVCVIGFSKEMKHDQSFLGASGGSRPRMWSMDIGVAILGRSYPTQARLIAEAEKLDATQAAVYTALNVDTTLTSTVTLSLVQGVRDVTRPGGEYFGHVITIGIDTKE